MNLSLPLKVLSNINRIKETLHLKQYFLNSSCKFEEEKIRFALRIETFFFNLFLNGFFQLKDSTKFLYFNG